MKEKFDSISKSGPKPFLIDEYVEEGDKNMVVLKKKMSSDHKKRCKVIGNKSSR
ncbi:MAG: hypothetical protein HOP07_15240 [Bacteriovoracaceae bacterium]|nr:hypothetical protein [Bacteriovoracaceae bacterium]